MFARHPVRKSLRNEGKMNKNPMFPLIDNVVISVCIVFGFHIDCLLSWGAWLTQLV